MALHTPMFGAGTEMQTQYLPAHDIATALSGPVAHLMGKHPNFGGVGPGHCLTCTFRASCYSAHLTRLAPVTKMAYVEGYNQRNQSK